MTLRRNDHDVTNSVNTTTPVDVCHEVARIYEDLYQREVPESVGQAFEDLARLYRGEYPGFRECDTHYHNTQHVLDVTLAMTRLMDGGVRDSTVRGLTERLFCFGVIVALFHDSGYIRNRRDSKHRNGAEYTLTHVSRGARFLEGYLPKLGLPDLARAATRVIHFTGYEIAVERIVLPDPDLRLVGNLLGSADILAQMADRCYLEKCYDRLYPEFVRGGIARHRNRDGSEEVLFASAADLIFKTPRFYQGATRRLNQDLGGCHKLIEKHFGGQNVYFDELEKNINYARAIAMEGDVSLLRRRPPGMSEKPEESRTTSAGMPALMMKEA